MLTLLSIPILASPVIKDLIFLLKKKHEKLRNFECLKMKKTKNHLAFSLFHNEG